MHKIGTEVAHITCDQDTNFQVKRSKARLQLVVMNRCHLAKKYKDVVNLQGRRHIVAAARLQLVVMCMTVLRVTNPESWLPEFNNIISLNRSSLTGTGQTLQAASTESEQERQQTKQLRRSACKSSGNQYT